MADNLKVTRYRNSNTIPELKDLPLWATTTTPAWCYYNNDPSMNIKYGKLYNWYVVNDLRGLAPKGWHIPTQSEWSTLITHLGGETVAGGKMKSISDWGAPNVGATNESGFSGLPGGLCTSYTDGKGVFGIWWSASEYSNTDLAWDIYLYYNDALVGRGQGFKQNGFSVRCIKD